MIIIPGSKKSLAKRYYANVIDYFIFFIITFIYIFTLGDVNDHGGYSLTGFRFLIIPATWFIYFPVMEGLTGQSLGKKMFHLYIVDIRGNPPTIVECFL